MIALQSERSFSPAMSIVPMHRAAITASAARPELPMDEPHQEWQIRLFGLQELICELLIKNQRLRVALLEATSTSPAESQARAV